MRMPIYCSSLAFTDISNAKGSLISKKIYLLAIKISSSILAQIFYPGVLYFENLNFGALFHLKKVRQNLNFQNETHWDRKFEPKMGDEIFPGQ